MSYVSYDVMIHWHMGVPRGGTEGRSEEHSAAEEKGGVLRPEPRRAVICGLTIAHANHGVTAVLAVHLPCRTHHCSDLCR